MTSIPLRGAPQGALTPDAEEPFGRTRTTLPAWGSAYSSFDCTNDDLGPDPAVGFFKQCYCAAGNQLAWYRPTSTGTASNGALESGALLYDALQKDLTCGNFKGPDGPRVPWEYGFSGGDQYKKSDDEPPTIFQTDSRSAAGPTKEKEIGLRSDDATVATGLHYEVAYVNLYSDCNTQDNIQVDVRPSNSGATCEKSGDHDAISVGSSSDAWAGVSGSSSSTTCLTASFPRISNGANDKSAFLSLTVELPNLATSSSAPGPRLPIDLVMQCSDDGSNECENQSSCMHMATFRDSDWSVATDAERAEVLAKRGFICQTSLNTRREPPRSTNGENQAWLYCELSDGRVYQLNLEQHIDTSQVINDNRARLFTYELTDTQN